MRWFAVLCVMAGSVALILAQSAPPTPAMQAGSGHPYGLTLTGITCDIEAQIQVRADKTTTAPIIKSLNVPTESTIGLMFADPYEGGGPDDDGDGTSQMAARYRCNDAGGLSAWSAFANVSGGQYPAHLSSYASGMQRAWWFWYDNFERQNMTSALEVGTPEWWDAEGSCGMDLFSGAARLTGLTNCYTFRKAVSYEEVAVNAKVECVGCSAGSSGNTDFVIQTHAVVSGGNITNYYQAKLEGSGTTSVATKWNKLHDVDGDGTVDPGEYGAACGTSADFSASWPLWLRVEVYDDPGNADGKRLRIWSAPDSSGSPGTWTLRSDVVDDPTTGTCNSSAWSGTGGKITGGGRIGIGVLKSGDHRYHEIAVGRLDSAGARPRPRRLP